MSRFIEQVTIRQARDHELGQLAELRWNWVAASRPDDDLPPLYEYINAATAWAREHQQTHLPFVAVRRHAVVGMAWLAISTRMPDPVTGGRRSGDLQASYVLPSHRGCGIGRRLSEAVLAKAAELGLEHVTVHASWQSLPMYERAGFRHNVELLWGAVR